MRITESQLRSVIKQELRKVLNESQIPINNIVELPPVGSIMPYNARYDNEFYKIYEYLKRQRDLQAPLWLFTFKNSEVANKQTDPEKAKVIQQRGLGPYLEQQYRQILLNSSTWPQGARDTYGDLNVQVVHSFYVDEQDKPVNWKDKQQRNNIVAEIRIGRAYDRSMGDILVLYKNEIKK